jgi:hypothetical protein
VELGAHGSAGLIGKSDGHHPSFAGNRVTSSGRQNEAAQRLTSALYD